MTSILDWIISRCHSLPAQTILGGIKRAPSLSYTNPVLLYCSLLLIVVNLYLVIARLSQDDQQVQ